MSGLARSCSLASESSSTAYHLKEYDRGRRNQISGGQGLLVHDA